jgi:diguanylate cyclase (GGDEF)-like protein
MRERSIRPAEEAPVRSLLTQSTLAKAHRLSLAFIVGLMLLPTTVSAWQLWSAANKIDYIAQVGVPGAHIIGNIDGLMNKYRKEQWQYLALKPGVKERQECIDSMAEEEADMRKLFASYRTLPLRSEDRIAVARYERDWNDYLTATKPELPLADAGKYTEAIATFNEPHGQEMWDALKADLKSWRAQDVAVAETYRADARRWSVLSLVAVAVLLAAAIGVAAYVGHLLAQRITRGLSRLSAAADGIASGDVDQRVEVEADDEIASVARAFEGMVEYLNGVVRKIEDQAQQLAALAHNDGLTGVPNRRAWDLELGRAVEVVRRSGAELTIAILDLDHFKVYNDTHGHQAGDALLRQAAAVWRAELRPSDLLARYGGEEFTILFVGLPRQQVKTVLDRLRGHTPFGQTFSAGVATWDGTETPQRLLGRADEALYQAKRDGRNRIAVASDAGVPAPRALADSAESAGDLSTV